MIVTFGTVPEVPAGRKKYVRHNDVLVVLSYERKSDEWDDPSLIYRYYTHREVTQADVVHVYVGDVKKSCTTRHDAWLLIHRILKDLNGHKKKVKVITSFEGLDPEIREKEQREIDILGVQVVELTDMSVEEYFTSIFRKYRSKI